MNPYIMRTGGLPDRVYMRVSGLSAADAQILAEHTVVVARSIAPKLSGVSSSRFEPVSGPGFFGVRWAQHRVWFQEVGAKAFTMRSLSGKTIPMWIDDPTGKTRQENPKAPTRITASGRNQVLIFRRAAKQGQRKIAVRDGVRVDVPASYPGAPGRIGARETMRPSTTRGRVGGQIARGNVGVRWRHPGLWARGFLNEALYRVAETNGLRGQVYASTGTVV
jgi:hypothetical protein